MTRPRTTHAEPEVVAARTRKAAAAAIANPDRLTLEQAADAMLPAAIEKAADFAERAFLAIVAGGDHLAGHITAGHAEWITLEAITDMQNEAARIADEIGSTAEQRHRLMLGQATVFDLRLAELQARTVFEGGTA